MIAQEEYEAFLNAQKAIGYKLGDITGTPEGDMTKYTELKIAASQEQEKIRLFNEAKMEAFRVLAESQDAERIALGVEWQAKEDNNYTL